VVFVGEHLDGGDVRRLWVVTSWTYRVALVIAPASVPVVQALIINKLVT
jgi:hypothetical protein